MNFAELGKCMLDKIDWKWSGWLSEDVKSVQFLHFISFFFENKLISVLFFIIIVPFSNVRVHYEPEKREEKHMTHKKKRKTLIYINFLFGGGEKEMFRSDVGKELLTVWQFDLKKLSGN